MAIIAATPRRHRRLVYRLLLRSLLILLMLPLAGGLAVWAYGPYWIAPMEDFAQGPGGAVAYITLINQITDQAPLFWAGQDVNLVMTEAELSGMVSSALLSGQTDDSPIRKVRADLVDGELRVETVLRFRRPDVPTRYHGPIGLKVRLSPTVGENGRVQFKITRATLGRIPLPRSIIRWAGGMLPATPPGYDPQEVAVTLPLGEMVASQLGRQIAIRSVSADDRRLHLAIALGKRRQ